MIVRRPPFPGMDPWLEDPGRWPDFHNSLIAAIRDELSPRLRPRYYVGIEQRSFVLTADDRRLLGIPDAQIVLGGPARTRPPRGVGEERGGVALAVDVEVDADVRVRELAVPEGEPVRETYLEIVDVAGREVVTVIEVLSPWNKGPGRADYLEKRREILGARLGFVEIDLLRQGMPLVDEASPSIDYRLYVRRGQTPRRATLYESSYKAAIPTIPIPLRDPDPDVPLELNRVLHDLCERAAFFLVTDYDKPPAPPLRPADADWAAAILRQAETPIAGERP